MPCPNLIAGNPNPLRKITPRYFIECSESEIIEGEKIILFSGIEGYESIVASHIQDVALRTINSEARDAL